MTLDERIKCAVLDNVLRQQLRGAKRSPQRAARNLIEFGCTLGAVRRSDAEREVLYAQLLPMLSGELQPLREWLYRTFLETRPV